MTGPEHYREASGTLREAATQQRYAEVLRLAAGEGGVV